jgi:hypothetical protein
MTLEIRRGDAGKAGTADTDQGSVPAPGGRDELSVPDYEDLGEQVSAILRTAEEAAEAILHNAVELAEQTRAEAQEVASAELDAARNDVESARQEAAAARAEAERIRSSRDRIQREASAAAAATRAAAEEEVLHMHEVATQELRQLAEEIASRRQELERASRAFERRLSRLASDIQPAERITRPPVVARGSTSALVREPAVERMVELAIAVVLAVAAMAAMVVLLVVLA